MREETVTLVRYSPIHRREVVVRLTYSIGEGPRPDIVRRFLVREEVLGFNAAGPLQPQDLFRPLPQCNP